MGSKLLTIKGRNTEMTAKFLCLLLSKYFMTKQKIIKAVVGKKETCLITRGKDGWKACQKVPRLQTFGIVSGSLYKMIWHEAKARHVWVLYGADGIEAQGEGGEMLDPQPSLALCDFY